MPTRREMIASTLGALVALPGRALVQTPAVTSVTEEQKGDPDLSYETVTFDPEAIRQLSDLASRKATFERWESRLPGAMLASARGLIGNSRTRTPERISEFLELFGLGLKDDKGNYVAFCAAGISYCALAAYANAIKPNYPIDKKREVLRSFAAEIEHYYFYPTVSCRDMSLIAQGKRRWVDRKAKPDVIPKPGWIVLFDWDKRGTPDHCGIVQNATKQSLFTVEFNTSPDDGSQRNGGAVASKTRNYDRVAGFVVTDERPRAI
jgi:hypothetical protein